MNEFEYEDICDLNNTEAMKYLLLANLVLGYEF